MSVAVAAVIAVFAFLLGLLLGKMLELRRSVPRSEVQEMLAEREELWRRTNEENQSRQDTVMRLAEAQYRQLAEELLSRVQKNNNANVNQLLQPYSQRLKEYQEQVQGLRESSERMRGEVRSMAQQTAQIGADARRLALTLSGGQKNQGIVGERLLAELLAKTDLQENVNYVLQKALAGPDGVPIHSETGGGTLIPDAVIRLPDSHALLIVDSKASFTAYQAYAVEDDREKRKQLLKAHCDSVERHIKDLTSKDYVGQYQRSAAGEMVDCLLMFVPSDAALQVALAERPELQERAARSNIYLVGPGNLLLAIRIVAAVWQRVELNRNTDQILAAAQKLLEDLEDFCQKFDEIGAQLDKAQATFQSAKKRLLKTPNGKVYSIADAATRLTSLGARSKQRP